MQVLEYVSELSAQSAAVVPVVVWGTATNGEIFREHARAKELTNDGAVLTDIGHAVAMGDLVGVQYKHHKAHARVLGIRQTSNDNFWSLSVKLLENSRCPWLDRHDQEALVSPRVPTLPVERRRSTRYELSIPLHLLKTNDRSPSFVTTRDISESGCYIETIFPLPKETQLTITLDLDGDLLLCSGVVKTCDVNVGMGIEFVDFSDTARNCLRCYILNHTAHNSPTTMVQ